MYKNNIYGIIHTYILFIYIIYLIYLSCMYIIFYNIHTGEIINIHIILYLTFLNNIIPVSPFPYIIIKYDNI